MFVLRYGQIYTFQNILSIRNDPNHKDILINISIII
jgi:hypothetical protein